MSDHDEPGHIHGLACLALEDLSQAMVGVAEEGLGRSLGYVIHWLDPLTGGVACTTNLSQEQLKAFMGIANEELEAGRIYKERVNGETVQ